VKLESCRKLTNEIVQILNNDGKSTNNPKTSASALYGYFLSLAEKKCILFLIILAVMMVVLIMIIVQYVICYRYFSSNSNFQQCRRLRTLLSP
jgi:hypothetical protein